MSKDIYSKLTKEFPKEAYSILYRKNAELTSIKAQYIVERLNEVFGLGGWRFDGEWKEVDDGVLFFGELSYVIEEGGENKVFTTGTIPGFSGTDVENRGDAYKGARTDALSKAASQIGVGNEVFKGLVKVESFKAKLTPKTLNEETPEEMSKKEAATDTMPNAETKSGKPATKMEFDDEVTDDVAPAATMPTKLKASRIFRRPTTKLNNT